MTLGVIGKDGVLEGSTPKIKDKQVPGRKYAVHPRSEEIFVSDPGDPETLRFRQLNEIHQLGRPRDAHRFAYEKVRNYESLQLLSDNPYKKCANHTIRTSTGLIISNDTDIHGNPQPS